MFLYREALVAGVSVPDYNNPLQNLEQLKRELAQKGIGMSVDQKYKQIYLFESRGAENELQEGMQVADVALNGQIVDRNTGEELPYASLYWKNGKEFRGTSTNQNGRFATVLQVPDSGITITARYVGYRPLEIRLQPESTGQEVNRDLTFRLEPIPVQSNTVYIHARQHTAGIDTNMAGLLEIRKWSPLGESNTIRTMQTLPSVSQHTALNDGINVRGSSPSGFLVKLDGVTIYSPSHLFGLLDSFNADALQTGGFYYDVIPAHYGSATGGLLSLHTRTGSKNNFRGSAGLSNTAFRAQVEGPVTIGEGLPGQLSYLVSGRHSYMNQVNWMGNQDLLQYGLNIERDRSTVKDLPEIDDRLVSINDYEADFYDLHGNLFYESRDNRIVKFSFYTGADEAGIFAERKMGFENGRFPLEDITTRYDWRNNMASGEYSQIFNSNYRFTSRLGITSYSSTYQKDDFTYYQRVNQNRSQRLGVQIAPYEQDNEVVETSLNTSLRFTDSRGSWIAGFEYYNYDIRYSETNRPDARFETNFNGNRLDIYTQYDAHLSANHLLESGVRLQHYTDGDYWHFSPRIQWTGTLVPGLKSWLGVSQNIQYLNQLNPPNSTGIKLWVPATEGQPPASVKQVSAGLQYTFNSGISLRTEGYYKVHENIRLHELSNRYLSSAVTSAPWYYQNDGIGNGIEFWISLPLGKWSLNQTYTLSEIELENPIINNGEPYNPDWDRRHRYSLHMEYEPISGLSIFSSLLLAGGTSVNRWNIENELLVVPDKGNTTRLDPYKRVDAGITWQKTTETASISARLSFFNLLNWNNPWYIENILAIDKDKRPRSMVPVEVEVYDLGFQPSFDITLRW